MRGRITVAILALVAFCASFGAPLQPLFAQSMSCCPGGKASSCCKRKSGPGWTANAASCGTMCACAFPSSGAPTVASATPATHHPTPGATLSAAPVAIDSASAYQAFLYQRPPPARV